MKIAVIGSNSFSGASFTAHLLGLGVEVLGVSRSAEADAAFLPYKWLDGKAEKLFRFRRLDLNKDAAEVLEAVRGFRPGAVVNFAAQSMVAQSWENPHHWYQTNVVANVKLFEGLRRMDFLDKYVHVSTPEVYGSCEGVVTESAPFNPSTPYAASRAACDLHLKTLFARHRFPVVFTRAANVYGPGQQLYRIIPKTVLFARLGKQLPLDGGGRSVRSFIHMADVSDATWKVAQKGVPGEAYHVSTDLYVTVRALVEKICGLMGVDPGKLIRVAEERPGKDAAYTLSSEKLRRELGWKDRVSLEDGLRETIQWADRHLETLRSMPFDYVHKE